MADTAKLRLSITVDYDLNGTDVEELKSLLKNSGAFFASEGLLSGETEANVTSWHVAVHKVVDQI